MLPLRRHLPCSCEAVNSPAPPFQQRPDYSEWTSDPGVPRFSVGGLGYKAIQT
jgi:hypothetical protein